MKLFAPLSMIGTKKAQTKTAITVYDYQLRLMTRKEEAKWKAEEAKYQKAVEDNKKAMKRQAEMLAEKRDLERALKQVENAEKREQGLPTTKEPTTDATPQQQQNKTSLGNVIKPKAPAPPRILTAEAMALQAARERKMAGVIKSFDKVRAVRAKRRSTAHSGDDSLL